MAIKKKYFQATPGAYSLTAPEIAYATILHVEREGAGHRVIDGLPATGERACQYVESLGQLIFDSSNPFTGGVLDTGPTSVDLPNEIIFVLWKE